MLAEVGRRLGAIRRGIKRMKSDLRAIRAAQVEQGTALTELLERITTMATQEQVDQLAAQLDAIGGSLSTALAGIQSDIDALKAAHPDVDLSGLQQRVDALAAVAEQAAALDAANPEPQA